MKPLKRCANGCDAPPHPPSKVLCRACFRVLCEKFERLPEMLKPAPKEG